jgi:hypothetical protein
MDESLLARPILVDIAMVIVGIVYAVRRARLNQDRVPSKIDHAKVIQWLKATQNAIDVFLWATWGAFLLRLLTLAIISGLPIWKSNKYDSAVVFLWASPYIIWLAGMVIASVLNRKADKFVIQ